MGFSYHGYGYIQPCWVDNGKVYRRLPSGYVASYPTKLDVTIPEQLNLFYGPTIAFWLQDDNFDYIGRNDGSISVVRKLDGLLYGLNFWEGDKYARVRKCGFYLQGTAQIRLFQDLTDAQSLYLEGQPCSSSLKAPYHGEFNDMDSTLSSLIDATVPAHIYTKGGEMLATDTWTIQKSIRRRDCRMFL